MLAQELKNQRKGFEYPGELFLKTTKQIIRKLAKENPGCVKVC